MLDVTTILEQFPIGAIHHVAAVDIGLIHKTLFIDAAAGRFVLQRLHPKLASEAILSDYVAVLEHLADVGLDAPRLIYTRQGAPSLDHEGACWRLITRLPGETQHSPRVEAEVEAAACALGRFHRAMSSFKGRFRSDHPLHRTQTHLDQLEAALEAHPEWRARLGDDAAFIRDALAELWISGLPISVVHGDPKFSNVIFHQGRGALIDLDTCNHHTRLVDLGDATRSWCREGGEDEQRPLRLDRFEALLRGYVAEGPPLSALERAALAVAGPFITLELSARFLWDVIGDGYFGWDAARYPSRRAHNQARAAGMLYLARDMLDQRAAMRAAVEAICG
ncbi:phosphotransferase [Myxococcota bacterium]|nr:phosphotransferase [Myxococcota bacterium]MBU1430699.1 phosphotransferase [Myxococcota bacterium]MBU1896738.1 phosphotransferase [Myxococcota bacterium]